MLVARRGLSPVMVGRGHELERLRRLVDEGGAARVVLVSGEAGVGKTRLVQEVLDGLAPGTRVLGGQAEPGGIGRPYELLLDAVESSVAGWTAVPAQLAGRRDALEGLLAPVAPALGRHQDRTLTTEELLRAAVELLRELVEPDGRAVLVFEDLHWADAESLALFARLATTADLPLVLIGTYRPEDPDRRQLADVLATIDRQRTVERVELGPLSQADLAELLAAVYGRAVPFRVAEALYRRTLGNPFFVEELLGAAHEASPEELPDLPLPANLTDAVLRRLDELQPDERRVVDAAAVLGQRIPFDLLAAVTGMGEAKLIESLRLLVARGLIAEEDTDLFSFRHALARESVAASLLGRERRRLHEKALAALQEQGSDDWAALAHHASGAGRWDELVEAARHGAARYLRNGSPSEALRLAELGLASAPDDLRLHELAATAAWSIESRGRAVERAERWQRVATAAGEDRSRTRALRLLARLRWEEGDTRGQQRAIEEVLAVAERLGPSPELAAAYNLVAESRMLAFQPEEALSWADRALAMADELGAADVRAATLVNKGSAVLDLPGRTEEGIALLEEAAAAAEAQGDHVSALRAVSNLGRGMYLVWPPERTRALMERMAELVERSGRRDWVIRLRSWRRQFLMNVAGDLAGARATLIEDADGLSDFYDRRWGALEQADIAFEAGELERAAELLEVALEFARRAENSEQRMWAEGLAVQLAARREGPEAAAGMLESLLAHPDVLAAKPKLPEAVHSALHAAVRAGLDPDRARRLAGLDRDGVTTVPTYDDPAWPAHLRGGLLEADKDLEGAVAAWQDALVERGRRRRLALTADVHQGLARCLAGLGQPDAARAHAETALGLLERWPGWRKLDAEALVRRFGGGRQQDGPGHLTPREREVACLLAEGLSNAEIGRRLYISTKTASVHVSNILAKLDMSSRAEIAAWAVREGLAG